MLGTWRVVSLVGRGNGWKRFLRKEKELWGSYGGKGGRVRYLSVVGRGNDGGVGLLDSSCLLHKRESTLREGTNLLANKRGIVGEFCSRYSTKTVEKETSFGEEKTIILASESLNNTKHQQHKKGEEKGANQEGGEEQKKEKGKGEEGRRIGPWGRRLLIGWGGMSLFAFVDPYHFDHVLNGIASISFCFVLFVSVGVYWVLLGPRVVFDWVVYGKKFQIPREENEEESPLVASFWNLMRRFLRL